MTDTEGCSDLIRDVTIRYFAQRYIVPFQLCFGVVGGVLTLMVLNSKSVRNKTTVFLTGLVVSDLTFMLSRMSLCLASFHGLAQLKWFRKFYFATKIPFVHLANWSSAASIWFALSVTVERTLAMRSPFGTRVPYKTSRIVCLIATIIVVSCALTFYHHVWYEVDWSRIGCGTTSQNVTNDTSPMPITSIRKSPSLKSNEWLQKYIDTSIVLGMFAVVLLPLVALAILNGCLIHYIRRSRVSVQELGNSTSWDRRKERKLTVIVCVIIFAFIVFNVPSVFVQMLHFITNIDTVWFVNVAEVSNNLVLAGKAINFLLYCVSSENFRKHIAESLWLCVNRCRKQKTSNATSSLELQPLYTGRAISESTPQLHYRTAHFNHRTPPLHHTSSKVTVC